VHQFAIVVNRAL